MSRARGDTIIEVMLAFAIFAALAVSVTTIMNSSIAATQRSLDTTLVRQQIDSQADLLRYARDNQLPEWDTIKAEDNLFSGDRSVLTGAFTTCPDHTAITGSAGSKAFFVSYNNTGAITRNPITSLSNFVPAPVYSRVNLGSITPRAEGLWVLAVHAQGSSGSPAVPVKAYDMYIRTCWNSPGQTMPMTITTIVRLYDY